MLKSFSISLLLPYRRESHYDDIMFEIEPDLYIYFLISG